MRFGILGYGGIAQRFVHDSLQVEETEITWIASQTPAKREAAAAAVPDARIADNYQACLASPDEIGIQLFGFADAPDGGRVGVVRSRLGK